MKIHNVFNPTTVKNILEMIGRGVPYKVAAPSNGVSANTFRQWLAFGKQDVEPYDQLYADYQIAHKKCQAMCVEGILRAGKKDWRAYQYYLERMDPDTWSADRDIMREFKRELRKMKDLDVGREEKLLDMSKPPVVFTKPEYLEDHAISEKTSKESEGTGGSEIDVQIDE